MTWKEHCIVSSGWPGRRTKSLISSSPGFRDSGYARIHSEEYTSARTCQTVNQISSCLSRQASALLWPAVREENMILRFERFFGYLTADRVNVLGMG